MANLIHDPTYVRKQVLKHLGLLHDVSENDVSIIDAVMPKTIKRVERCWSEIANKYYQSEDTSTLNIDNSNQYTQFLLLLANELSISHHKKLADKFFALNKMINSCDIYHEVALPDSFYVNHSIGIIVGRASLGNRLFLSQNCTIGGNPGSPLYPNLGHDNYLMANATIVGDVVTGDRVIFAAGSYAKNISIPSNSIVFGQAPNNVIKPLEAESFKKASPFK
ncbi:MAG: transferase [Alphaproteobacteria bacterium]|nr:transferase [Alphaproteobacteria bacterium]|tara:strand:- start:11888 stop:12553 length:666 start_codon:yes stop_codon:yes gene_type:complete